MEASALKHYLAMKKAQKAYLDRKRDQKKADGTYRPVGRPKKVVEVKPESVESV